MKEFNLILGCRGRQREDITICSGTSSVLFQSRFSHKSDVFLYDYLFKIHKLNSRPVVDQNGIVNLIQFLSSGYIQEDRSLAIHEWLSIHKKCGCYIYKEDL